MTTGQGNLPGGFPTPLLSVPDEAAGSANVFCVVYALFAVLGLYLTYIGWRRVRAAMRRRGEKELRRAA